MSIVALRTQIIESQRARHDLIKWKLFLVAVLGATGLGVSGFNIQTPTFLKKAELLLALIPLVCVYVDAICSNLSLRIIGIGAFIRNHPPTLPDEHYAQSYEEFIRGWDVPPSLEFLALYISTQSLCGLVVFGGFLELALRSPWLFLFCYGAILIWGGYVGDKKSCEIKNLTNFFVMVIVAGSVSVFFVCAFLANQFLIGWSYPSFEMLALFTDWCAAFLVLLGGYGIWVLRKEKCQEYQDQKCTKCDKEMINVRRFFLLVCAIGLMGFLPWLVTLYRPFLIKVSLPSFTDFCGLVLILTGVAGIWVTSHIEASYKKHRDLIFDEGKKHHEKQNDKEQSTETAVLKLTGRLAGCPLFKHPFN